MTSHTTTTSLYPETLGHGLSLAESRKGHRARLFDRYENTGLVGFAPYEILELALTLLIPRVDTKRRAKDLLHRFGSISAVLQAPPRELTAVGGIGASTATKIRFLHDFHSYCLQESFVREDFIRSQKDVSSYLGQTFSDRVQEYVVVLYLDTQNRIMSHEIVAEGSVDHCSVYPRKIFDRALQVGAASILLAHNHPGGSREPSEADWELTKKLVLAGELLQVSVVDHLIIAGGETVSLRSFARWSAFI